VDVNRLANATSPYLLQHRDNPVDWWQWEPEAFESARERDVPVLLSIGYAACHWCHVMAHESFEDAEVARVLNAGFVPIKVDREERPDIDAVYMAATTATTGHGGWPMTVLLTPDGDPFYCGTYFPRSHFLSLLGAASDAWRTQREQVLGSSAHVAEAIRAATAPAAADAVTSSTLDSAVATLGRGYDHVNGGFGTAPKFPPSMVLAFLLRHHGRTADPVALGLATGTCEVMARGGMYDQLAGGFSRYAVDAAWVVPHFEKMLYDNAQLARVYLHWWKAGGSELARRTACETADFILRDLGTADGGFASALDADTEGVEGLTYAWTPEQLTEVLGDEDGAAAALLLSVTEVGTFEHGASTLQLRHDPVDPQWWSDVRARLLVSRATRSQPGRDDKVVTSWNGLAIAALADLGATTGERRYVEAAQRCATFLLDVHLVGGRLRRSSRNGVVGAAAAVADDHGNLAEGLLVLHQATGQARWLVAAGELLDVALERFRTPEGGFHDTADDAEALFARPHSASDNAEPSGQSSLAGALLSYGALTGSARHLQAASEAVDAGGSVAGRDPRFAGWTLAVAEAREAGPLQVAVVGTGPAADDLSRVARGSLSPGLVLVAGEPDAPGIPLLAGRPLVGGKPAAYVCRGFVCERPLTAVDELSDALQAAKA
jgi:uncharacterized protein YyaL (SSP411 family)